MAKVTYENTTCGRCGGSGHYSFNRMTGTRCFKCGGSGVQLTKRGAAAKEFADGLLEVRIEDVPEGRYFSYDDVFFGKRYRFLTAVERHGDDGTRVNGKAIRSFNAVNRDGETVVSMGEGCRVRLMITEEDVEQINAYQDSLTKAGKPRKR